MPGQPTQPQQDEDKTRDSPEQQRDPHRAPTEPLSRPNPAPRRPAGTGPLTRADIDELLRQTAPLSQAEIRRAENTIIHLQQKIAAITVEFNAGRINQSQFEVLYTRYGEQIALIRQILDRNPPSDARRQPPEDKVSTGHLREQYAARAIGCVLCSNLTGEIIHTLGDFDLKTDLLIPILSGLETTSPDTLSSGRRCTQIEGGRWLCIAPGEQATTIVIFNREPSAEQLDRAVETHRAFEKANRQALLAGHTDSRRFTYPQRVLFEETKE